jgi:hypothetical protein
LLYDGWVFYSRWDEGRQFERAREEKEAQDARRTLDKIGGGGLKILGFYASPASIHRGTPTNICYSVAGAKHVRIDPPIKTDLYPAFSYCFQASPRKNTQLTLHAADDSGHEIQQSLALSVVPQ